MCICLNKNRLKEYECGSLFGPPCIVVW